MTRLLFLPDDQTLVMLESPLSTGDLVARVNQGQWTPPAPYAAMNPAALYATRQGRTVIVTPHQAFDLTDTTLEEIHRLLKPRQRQVLLLLAQGLSIKEIAAQLNLHPRTVAMHIATLKGLFGAGSRAQFIRRAVELGFFED
jgi:DNA-binding CsgD family transcriptional regulator